MSACILAQDVMAGVGHTREGYARFSRGGWVLAHRHVYEECFGEIPKGTFVCHRCDNPPCVNPEHLFLGTHRENMRDRDAKGRVASGSRHYKTVFSCEEVMAIFHAEGSQQEIASRFGTDQPFVSRVKNRRTWHFRGAV